MWIVGYTLLQYFIAYGEESQPEKNLEFPTEPQKGDME